MIKYFLRTLGVFLIFFSMNAVEKIKVQDSTSKVNRHVGSNWVTYTQDGLTVTRYHQNNSVEYRGEKVIPDDTLILGGLRREKGRTKTVMHVENPQHVFSELQSLFYAQQKN